MIILLRKNANIRGKRWKNGEKGIFPRQKYNFGKRGRGRNIIFWAIYTSLDELCLYQDRASCMSVHGKFLVLGTGFGVIHLLDAMGNSLSSRTRQGYRPVVCPNFGHPALTSSSQVYALCRSCKHATKIKKIIIHHSKAETISISIHNCCKTIFNLKKIYLLNDEVRAECPKGILPQALYRGVESSIKSKGEDQGFSMYHLVKRASGVLRSVV